MGKYLLKRNLLTPNGELSAGTVVEMDDSAPLTQRLVEKGTAEPHTADQVATDSTPEPVAPAVQEAPAAPAPLDEQPSNDGGAEAPAPSSVEPEQSNELSNEQNVPSPEQIAQDVEEV